MWPGKKVYKNEIPAAAVSCIVISRQWRRQDFASGGGGHENSSIFFLNRLMSLLYLYLYYNNLVTITNLQTKFQSLSHSH
jgi:hypothetical protein